MAKYIFLILLGGCSFGILSTFVKLAYGEGYSLADVTSAQAYFGAAILWCLLLLYRVFYGIKKNHPSKSIGATKLERQRTVRFLMLTGLASGAISICYYKCVQTIPASIAIILLMQYTWISMLLERIIFKKPLGLRQLSCLFLILIGTVLGSGLIGASGELQLDLKGVGYGLLAAFFYALFLLANGYVGNQLAAVQKSSWILVGVCAMIMVIFPPFETLKLLYYQEGHGLLTYFKGIWPWGVLLGLFGMVLPPLLFAAAIPKTGVALGSILGAIELPTAAICAYYILDEPLHWIQLLGIFIILFSIILINLKSKNSPITAT